MKRYINCENLRSYPHNIYSIYDTGYGFVVYKGNKAISEVFLTSREAHEKSHISDSEVNLHKGLDYLLDLLHSI